MSSSSLDFFEGEQEKEEYFFLCVLDFEATCWNNNEVSKQDMEVIEFPSVLYKVEKHSCKHEFISEFSKYVRPTIHPLLSPFCTELTGITQEQVDSADPIEIVYQQHIDWLTAHVPADAEILFATCGDWDFKIQFPQELKRKGLSKHAHYKQFINVKTEIENMYGGKVGGMVAILNKLKLPLIGRHHSGIDDTRNIATIVLTLLDRFHSYEHFTIKRIPKC
jgi:ERI1 exoribonuclease 3